MQASSSHSSINRRTSATPRSPLDLGYPMSSRDRRHTDGYLYVQPSGRSLRRQSSTVDEIVQDMERATVAALLVTGWAGTLLWWLKLPGKWTIQFLRLLVFVVLLLPAFLRMFWHYLMHPSVIKNIPYGAFPRQSLDVWEIRNLAGKEMGKLPVVVFVSGGAWIIGYKMWGFLMGRVFQENGVIFVTPDYRNFPQATVGDMISDADAAVKWVFDNIHHFGGDPTNVTLMGQSAGSHIASLLILRQAEREAQGLELRWTTSDLQRFIGISGPYNIVKLAPSIHKRGLHISLLNKIMDNDCEAHSPALRVKRYMAKRQSGIIQCLPPIHLYHGTADATVSSDHTKEFATALKAAGASVEATFYDNKSHTDPIIEDPIAGSDPLMLDLLRLLNSGHQKQTNGQPSEAAEGERKIIEPTLLPQIAPKFCIKLAKIMNPF